MKISIHRDSPLPIYRQIAGELRRHIADQNLTPGSQLPSLEEISNTAGVSLRTAEKGVGELIREGLCVRRPKKGTYVAPTLSPSRPARRVVLVHQPLAPQAWENDMLQASLMRGMTCAAHAAGIDLLIIGGELGQRLAGHRREEYEIRGVVFPYFDTLDEGSALAAQHPDLRFVFLNYELRGFDATPENMSGIFSDDFAGAYQATGHLLQQGRRALSIFGLDIVWENYRRRIEGCRRAMEDHGLSLRKESVLSPTRTQGDDLQDLGRRMAEQLLVDTPGCNAVLCLNDLLAAGAAAVFAERGVAERISVVAYDHLFKASNRRHAAAAVEIDFARMGAAAVERLLAPPGTRYPKVMRLTPQFIALRPGVTLTEARESVP